MLPFNLNHLYYFYIIARNRSFTAASRELMVSQSSLSIQMKQFESALGHKLFNRRKTGVDLTESGEIVYRGAERIFQEVDLLHDSLEEAERLLKGSIAIGTVNSVGIYLLPDLLKAFRHVYPEVRIKVEFKHAREVLEMVQTGKIDIAIITWHRKYGDLAAIPLQRNKMFLVCPPDHPVAQKKRVSPRDLEDYPFIGYEVGSPSRTMMDGLFKRMSLDIEYVMESADVVTIKHMVLAGLGLAILPEVAIGEEIREGQLLRLDVPTLVMAQEVTLYYKARRTLSPTAREFIEFLKEQTTRKTKVRR